MATPIPSNRAPFTVEEIARATGGRVVQGGAPSVGVCTDSRAVTEGAAFVALVGDKFDGHAFLAQVAALGARTLVVSRGDAAPADVGVVHVADTKKALGDLARAHRTRWARSEATKVVAITGSAGKTTTKTVLARLLDSVAPGQVHASAGNLNNDVGVPMTLFGLEDAHRYAVVEVGTSARGEIANLASIARPDVAVVTLVAPAHTEGIGSVEDVAREKGSLFAALSPAGLAVANGDDARVVAELGRSPASAARTYGFSDRADYHIALREARGTSGTRLRIDRRSGASVETDSPLLGDAGALAVAASLAVVEWLVGRPMTEAEVGSALATLESGGEGRLTPVRLADGTLLIDDSYNANPASMRSSIGLAAELSAGSARRLLLVLGEMRELGALSASEHTELGRFAAAKRPDHVVAIGGDARYIANEVTSAGGGATFTADAAAAVEIVSANVQPGDVVLVKGSRSIATEKIVRALISARGAL